MDVPLYALFDEGEFRRVEVVSSIDNSSAIVIATDPNGSRRFASMKEWAAGAQKFDAESTGKGIVTSESPVQDKIRLFRSYFKGRPDAYGHGYRKRTGGIAYAVACEHEGNYAQCPRMQKWRPCGTCPNRKLKPLTDEAIHAHFKGARYDFRDVIGLYPLDESCKTFFLAADFDKTGWQREVTAYRKACEQAGIPVAIERSRSGHGGHAWIFFETAVDASLARNVGMALMTDAMANGGITDFRAYDRFFPAQDTIAEGGFGNLIALPLQGRAVRQDNSVFVDERFERYPDQCRYLSGLEKLSEQRAREYLENRSESPIGTLAGNQAFKESTLEQQQLPLARASKVSRTDFPKTVHIENRGRIVVKKESASPAALDRIRRLAAFANPDFRILQNAKKSVFGTHRVISLAEETESEISLPRGCAGPLLDLLDSHDVAHEMHECRHEPNNVRVAFTGELRETQKQAVDAMLKWDTGILEAPTGYGKTVMAAAMIAELKVRTLIIVPGTALLRQWREKLEVFLAIDEELPELLTPTGRKSRKKRSPIGCLGAGKSELNGFVDVAIIDSLSEKTDIPNLIDAKPLVGSYDLVIIDECHKAASEKYGRVLRAIDARHLYGLSATPKRADGLSPATFLQCGPIRYSISPLDQAAEQHFKRLLVPRFTSCMLDIASLGNEFMRMLRPLSEKPERNELIVSDACRLLDEGRHPLVLTRLVEHAKLLATGIANEGWQVETLIGSEGAKAKRERLDALKTIPENQPFAVVAMMQYAGEGFDEPRLDSLLLALPVSYDTTLAQCVGRLHRDCAGKKDALVYDYADMAIPRFGNVYRKRLQEYAKLGYTLAEGTKQLPDNQYSAGEIVDWRKCDKAFSQDIQSASSSVLISVGYANPKKIALMAPILESAITHGVSMIVTIGENRKTEYASSDRKVREALANIGCEVRVADSFRGECTIIDGRIVWFGNVTLLAFPKRDEYSLRIKSVEVARSLEANFELSGDNTKPDL